MLQQYQTNECDVGGYICVCVCAPKANMHALGLRVAFTADVSFLIVVTGKTRSRKENGLRSSSQFSIPRRDDQVSAYIRNETY